MLHRQTGFVLRALRGPIPRALRAYADRRLLRLALFARLLGRCHGAAPFALRLNQVAAALGVPHGVAARMLRRLKRDGVIRRARSPQGRRPALYAYAGP